MSRVLLNLHIKLFTVYTRRRNLILLQLHLFLFGMQIHSWACGLHFLNLNLGTEKMKTCSVTFLPLLFISTQISSYRRKHDGLQTFRDLADWICSR